MSWILVNGNCTVNTICTFYTLKSKNEFENEINLLKELDHPNIEKIIEYFFWNDKYYIITEHCKEGDLFKKINQVKTLNEAQSAIITYQILLALAYCHGKKVIHQNIKLENIFIEEI